MNIHYLACPFTHADRLVMGARVEASMSIQVMLLRDEGIQVFNPLPHSAHVQYVCGLKFAHEFVMPFDLEIIRRLCKNMYLLKIDGWDVSVGIGMELHLAEILGMEIIEIEPEQYGIQKEFPHAVRGQITGFLQNT